MSEARRPWLFSPVQDLLWGSGVAYLSLFLLLCIAGSQVHAFAPLWLMMLLVVAVSMPHYGATLLRVYEQRDERRKYAFFTLYTTILLAVAFVWGLASVAVGSVLFTLYLTWSPWHYTGQNYGIALMFLGRRGVEVGRDQKRALYGSFVLSYVITFFFLHGSYTTSTFLSGEVAFLSLQIPALWADTLLFAASLAYLAMTARVVIYLWRRGGRRSMPALVLMLTQAVWFVLPAWFRNWIPYEGGVALSTHFAAYAFTWIALGHAAQYLWITCYFAHSSGRSKTHASFYVKALLAGAAIWTIPALLFAPNLLGRIPYDAGLASMVAAIVNLHHFILDGAIWKLRDGRIAGVLMPKSSPSPELAPRSASGAGPRRFWPIVATAGLLSVFIHTAGTLEGEFGLQRAMARQDLERAATAADRLAWLGRESAKNRSALGVQARNLGDLERSREQLRLAVAIVPSPRSYLQLGDTLRLLDDWSGAAEAYERSVELDDANEEAWLLLAVSRLELGDLERAQAIFEDPRVAQLKTSVRGRGIRKELEKRLQQAASAADY